MKLEIAEHLILANPYEAMSVIPQLRQLGIQLQIDNFGRIAALDGCLIPTLLYNQFGRVKIDRMLINRIDKDVESLEIFNTLVSNVVDVNLEIIASGIETLEQLDRVKQQECQYGQGYLFGKPVAESAIGQLLEQQKMAG